MASEKKQNPRTSSTGDNHIYDTRDKKIPAHLVQGDNYFYYTTELPDSQINLSITELSKLFSRERVEKFNKIATESNSVQQLYFSDVKLSFKVFEILNIFEVALRNFVVDAFMECYGIEWRKTENIFDLCSLKKSLNKAIPEPVRYWEKFVNLRYAVDCAGIDFKTKYDEKMLCQYLLNTLANDLQDPKRTLDNPDWNVEHIIPKTLATDENAEELKIGNIMMIEQSLNEECGSLGVSDKLAIYKRSDCAHVKQFLGVNGMRRKKHFKNWNTASKDVTWKPETFGQKWQRDDDKTYHSWIEVRGWSLLVEFDNLLRSKLK
ncbi:MAG: HNH endonuclease family protein [Candidatus Ancillula sp.]|jgi:hypothetical protein|nr:HNH endonuclease family protein [Candidatus Ancillula sp.]